MTNLRLLCILIVLAAVCWQAQSSPEIIKVSNGSPWGSWGKVDMCPDGMYAGGINIAVEGDMGGWGDDTALNGIRLHCVKKGVLYKTFGYVQSHPGYWGYWTQAEMCYSGMTRFQLRVEPPQGSDDDTAVNNISVMCPDEFHRAHMCNGGQKGSWGSWSNECSGGKVICGIQTKVESKQPWLGDDTALNDVRFFCCPK